MGANQRAYAHTSAKPLIITDRCTGVILRGLPSAHTHITQGQEHGPGNVGADSDVSAADEVMRQAVDALRRYHEALPCASLEALEPLKADAKQKFASASLCRERVLF